MKTTEKIEAIIHTAISDFNSKWQSANELLNGVTEHAEKINELFEQQSNQMQTMKLVEDTFNQLSKGKRVTIRKGRKDVQLGNLKFVCTGTGREEIVNVINVHYCKLSNIYIGDLQNDGFNSHHDLWEGMQRFYPLIQFEDEMTTIKFTK